MANLRANFRGRLALAMCLVLLGCGPVQRPQSAPSPAQAAQEIGGLKITDAIIRPGQAGATTAAYLAVSNHGAVEDRLLGAASPLAARVEIHRHVKKPGGLMAMQQVEGGLALPAQGQLAFTPGGLHVMMFGLKRNIVAGEAIPMTLVFERAGPIQLEFVVGIPARPAPAGAHHGH